MATKPKQRTFVIVPEMKVKGPFSVEGTNQVFDFANEYPIPAETVSIIDGKPTTLRFILGCDTLVKEEQIKRGFPADRASTEEERMLLTFVGARNTIPEGYPQLEEYFEKAPWFKGLKGPRPVNSRIIYEELDEAAIEEKIIDTEKVIQMAKSLILEERSRENLMNLYRMSKPGGIINPQIETRTIRIHLLELAAINPEWIIKGMKVAAESLVVLVTKALDYEILSIDIVGKLAMRPTGGGDLQIIADVPDTGGRAAKVERVAAWMQTDQAKGTLDEVKSRVSQRDTMLRAEFGEDEVTEKVTENVNTGSTTDQTTVADPL